TKADVRRKQQLFCFVLRRVCFGLRNLRPAFGIGAMAVVAGVDFGTQSVRVSIVDSKRGCIGTGVAEYSVKRQKKDPDFATQSHDDHMSALKKAMRKALADAGIKGQ